MTTLIELATSRKNWIETVLMPWCQVAPSSELIKAEIDWVNLAGGVDPKLTLWVWAWSRFPVLTHNELPGLNETNEVRVTLKTGEAILGYPDNMATFRGNLVLLTQTERNFAHHTPVSIDDIAAVDFADPSQSMAALTMPSRPLTTMPQFSSPDERI